ncbi:MAG TPA: hypothetical protein VG692_17275 [Gemmatimonadales bacterium]|nr:hypothetical protein [Gemmatimonadales bacterium]
MSRYREPDLSRVRTVAIGSRANKVDRTLLAHAPAGDRSFHAFLDSLPHVLAADHLRTVAAAIASAARARRGMVVLIGGHVIKVGLGPLLAEWVRQGVVTHVAMNGAAAIHDFELAAFGGTSEDVEAGLKDGTFGMAEETGALMNTAISTAHRETQGLGEGLAAALAARGELPGDDVSVLLACHRAGVPVTVHAAIGAEIIHQHPLTDGAALGATSHRDFRRLAGSLPDLDQGGVVLNLGSAVVLPEVFLKALTISRNLNAGKPAGFLAADFDMIRHYRPRMNVVERPTRETGGKGIMLTGHHEILFPLLFWAVEDLRARS